MFGWFKPTCPCDPIAKRWVEDRLQWCSRQFGLHILLERPIILPTDEFFPDPYDGSSKTIRQMFRRVCGYMEVDPDSVVLKLFDDQTLGRGATLGMSRTFAAGTWRPADESWQKNVIRIEKGDADRPADMIGTMAHELSHERLLGQGRAGPNAFDNELLTDLTTLFHGFGAFLANNPRKSTGELGRWPGSKLYRPEYISEPMLGYALAHIAWFRDESRPTWAKALRWSPRVVLKEGLRHLQETGDSTFKPVRLRETHGNEVKPEGTADWPRD